MPFPWRFAASEGKKNTALTLLSHISQSRSGSRLALEHRYGPRQVRGRQYSGKAELNVELRFAPFASERRRGPGKVSLASEGAMRLNAGRGYSAARMDCTGLLAPPPTPPSSPLITSGRGRAFGVIPNPTSSAALVASRPAAQSESGRLPDRSRSGRVRGWMRGFGRYGCERGACGCGRGDVWVGGWLCWGECARLGPFLASCFLFLALTTPPVHDPSPGLHPNLRTRGEKRQGATLSRPDTLRIPSCAWAIHVMDDACAG